MTEIDEEIQIGWTAAQRESPDPTVAYFHRLLQEHPHHPSALFAYASALDFAEREPEAAPAYERAFAAGLNGEELCRAILQYGSTLRNLGRYEEAVAALQRADREFPGHDSVKTFLALTLVSAGRSHEAVAELITLALERIASADLKNYEVPLRSYITELKRHNTG